MSYTLFESDIPHIEKMYKSNTQTAIHIGKMENVDRMDFNLVACGKVPSRMLNLHNTFFCSIGCWSIRKVFGMGGNISNESVSYFVIIHCCALIVNCVVLPFVNSKHFGFLESVTSFVWSIASPNVQIFFFICC